MLKWPIYYWVQYVPSNSITSSAKSQYDLFSYEIYMQIRMLLFNELSLEFVCKNPSNENNSCTQHTPFVMSLLVFCVIISMSFLWLLILYDFKSNEMSYQKVWILIKEVCLLMCIFPGLWTNTDFKSILVFMTQKSPDFSQKVWLLSSLVERKWWLQMVVVFPVWSQTMSRPFHSREWFWGGTEWGRLSSLGERIEGRVCSFGGGTEGRKTFLLMWLSCPRLSYFSRTTLICLSLIVSVFPVSMSYRSLTFIGVFCSTVGITHTSQSG